MTVLFSDNFSAALSGTNWSDEAGVWSTGSGVLGCSTNNFRVLNTTTTAHPATADVRVSAKRSSATFDGCVLARSNVSGATSSVGNCYFLNWFDSNTLQFFRRIAGVNNQVGTDVTATHANGDTIGLQVTGTGATVTLTAYVNGVQVGTVGDTAGTRIVVAGQTGIVGFNLNSRYDDFSVDDLASSMLPTLNPLVLTRTILRM